MTIAVLVLVLPVLFMQLIVLRDRVYFHNKYLRRSRTKAGAKRTARAAGRVPPRLQPQRNERQLPGAKHSEYLAKAPLEGM